MKVTTLAVLIANAAAAFHRREDSRLFDRRLDYSAVRNAAAILLLYLSLTFVGAAVISEVEGLPLGACLYETASAAARDAVAEHSHSADVFWARRGTDLDLRRVFRA